MHGSAIFDVFMAYFAGHLFSKSAIITVVMFLANFFTIYAKSTRKSLNLDCGIDIFS
jgi:hypothetical protein